MARPAFKNRHKLPYNYLLYEAMAKQGVAVAEFAFGRLLRERWPILHVHWPESLLETATVAHGLGSALRALAAIDLARRRGTQLVWTVHDLAPHDFVLPRLERWFWRAFLARVDGVIALSDGGMAEARHRFPRLAGLPGRVVPQGHFREAYPRTLDRAAARGRLGLPVDAAVVGFFGQVRPYKNVPHLVRTFRALARPDLHLVIAGRLNRRTREADEVLAAAAGDPRIHLHLGFVPVAEVETYVTAADLVACPFTEILNSASTVLALSFDRPVLAPRLGALGELQDIVGSSWLMTYDGELTPPILEAAIARSRLMAVNARAPLDSLAWPRLAAQTIEAYQKILATRPGAQLTAHKPSELPSNLPNSANP